MDEGNVELSDDLSKLVVAPLELIHPEEAKRWLEAWLLAWPWAKRAVDEEGEVPCAAPRAEVWTRAKAKAWEIANAVVTDEETRRMSEQINRNREAKAWEAMRLKARLHSRMAQAQVDALALVGVLGWVLSDARARGESLPSALVDSLTVRHILDCLNHYGAAGDIWHQSPEGRDEYSCLIHFLPPVTRLPIELLRQIFLIIIIDGASALPLLLVCKQWHAIGTSIWGLLHLGTRTPITAVTRTLKTSKWLLDIVMDTDSDRDGLIPSDGAFNAIFAAIEASSRWRSLVVESFPAQVDLPEDLVHWALQRCSNNPMTRFTTFKLKSACETSPLLDGLLRILGTAARELTTVEINSANVILFLAPAYPSIFHSIKFLSLDTPGIPNPVDLLPHLHQLETFTASHISFPIYHDDVDLPFIHTLRHLSLRAASIQWMNGRTFSVLEDCTLIFPLHRQVLYTFRTTLPNCKHLTFQGYPLEILGGVLAHQLAHLTVVSSGPFNKRGSRQLIWLSSRVLGEMQPSPQILHIGIEATNQTWVNALSFMSNLEELVIYSARPSSLRAKVLQSFFIQPTYASNLSTKSTPGGSCAPSCPLLRRFGLKYDRWLRPNEEFDLVPVFSSMIHSRYYSNCSLQSFILWIPGYQEPFELIDGSTRSYRGFDRLRGAIDHFPLRPALWNS